jgi:hypothetical protein
VNSLLELHCLVTGRYSTSHLIRSILNTTFLQRTRYPGDVVSGQDAHKHGQLNKMNALNFIVAVLTKFFKKKKKKNFIQKLFQPK